MGLFFVVSGEGRGGYILLGMKKALITGVTGQDGSYLAELLLTKGYEVHGLIRRASSFNTHRLDPIYRDPHESGVRFFMHYGDLSDSGSLVNLVRNLEPDEIYHLGAQSHVKVSFEIPEYTADATAMARFAFWRQSARPASTRASTRRARPRCSAAPRRRIPRTRHFIPAARTRSPRSWRTGWRSTTERPTACTHATASSRI